MKRSIRYFAAVAVAAMLGGQAHAASYELTLSGDIANFTNYQIPFEGLEFNEFSLDLSGLDSSDAITVDQGDTIDATVTLDSPYTIPTSQVRTDLLLYLDGSSFPSENTGVSGTFNFYDGNVLVNTFNYGSTTSSSLSNYAAAFPPSNAAFTFDSFTDDLTIDSLATPATLDSSNFTYALVSNAPAAAPEPSSWALMLLGIGGLGMALRARRRTGWDLDRLGAEAAV